MLFASTCRIKELDHSLPLSLPPSLPPFLTGAPIEGGLGHRYDEGRKRRRRKWWLRRRKRRRRSRGGGRKGEGWKEGWE